MNTNEKLTVISLSFILIITMTLTLHNSSIRRAADYNIGYLENIGSSVSELKEKLKKKGYYDREDVDDRYNFETHSSLIDFQKGSNLKANGILDKETAIALELSRDDESDDNRKQTAEEENKALISNDDGVYLIARAVHGEARGEPYIGKVAVAAVILNRVKSPNFPNTIAGVIYQPGAFTAVSDGQMNLAPDDESLQASRDALNGWDPTEGALYYYNPAKTTNRWIWTRPVHIVIGEHHFAR